jgi:hypothetical protein
VIPQAETTAAGLQRLRVKRLGRRHARPALASHPDQLERAMPLRAGLLGQFSDSVSGDLFAARAGIRPDAFTMFSPFRKSHALERA